MENVKNVKKWQELKNKVKNVFTSMHEYCEQQLRRTRT